MCTGVALAAGEVPVRLIERLGLAERLHERGGEPEFRFLFRDRPRQLPVIHGGRLTVARWDCRRGESKLLPRTGWMWADTVERGDWRLFDPEPVVIAATLGYEGGVWFAVRQGIRGLLVQDEAGAAVAYLLCEPASHYYQVMTRSARMPCLVGERI